jgi:hypothetical protein
LFRRRQTIKISLRGNHEQSRDEAFEPKEMSLSEQSVVTVTKDQVSCGLGTESAILNMKDGIYYGLDPVGTHVWNLLQMPRRVADIRDVLLQEYDVEPERCHRDLIALLEELLRAGLIEVREEGQDTVPRSVNSESVDSGRHRRNIR